MYTKEDHFLVKLLTNNAMQLEEEIKEKEKTIKSLMKANTDLHKNYNILKEKYDNAVRMLHSTEPVKQEVVTQPDLFTAIDVKSSKTPDLSDITGLPTLDKAQEQIHLEKPKRKIPVCPNGRPRSRTLDEATVRLIKEHNSRNSYSISQISNLLKIKYGIVNAIVSGKTYKNIN